MLTIPKNDGVQDVKPSISAVSPSKKVGDVKHQRKKNKRKGFFRIAVYGLPNDMSNHEIGIEQFIKLARMVFVQQG